MTEDSVIEDEVGMRLDILAFLELYEQDVLLQRRERPIGVLNGCVGFWRRRFIDLSFLKVKMKESLPTLP